MVTNFQRFVRNDIANQNISEAQVFNMDEMPMAFDIPNTRTVDEVGTKTVAITTTGHERTCFTVVLGCSATGEKLKSMVIFKRVTLLREKLPTGVVVECNKKGWMNTEVMKT